MEIEIEQVKKTYRIEHDGKVYTVVETHNLDTDSKDYETHAIDPLYLVDDPKQNVNLKQKLIEAVKAKEAKATSPTFIPAEQFRVMDTHDIIESIAVAIKVLETRRSNLTSGQEHLLVARCKELLDIVY